MSSRCLWLTKGLGRGGVERLLVDMFPLVDRARFEIDVAYVLPWKDTYHEDFEQMGARTVCLGNSGVSVGWMRQLRRLIAERDYDLIHTHAPLPAVAARSLTVGRRRPLIVHTEHNMWDRYRWPTRWANSATYSRNRAVIAVSDSVAETIRPLFGSVACPIDTIHHGTVLSSVRQWSTEERQQRRTDLGLPAVSFLIGNVGNFTAKKDHRNLLHALAGDGPVTDTHLVLVGLGPLEHDLRSLSVELGIDHRTTFLGSRDDVFELLPLFDLFCLSSEFEGFPIALVEAMATGLPCVATSAGGIPEVIDAGENGLLVPPRDHLALRAAIEQVMKDPDQATRLGAKAKATAEGLDLRHAVTRLHDIYQQVLNHD